MIWKPSPAAVKWLEDYGGSIDSTAMLLAFDSGAEAATRIAEAEMLPTLTHLANAESWVSTFFTAGSLRDAARAGAAAAAGKYEEAVTCGMKARGTESCNRHSDCAAAGSRAVHCHDEGCEDCFGR